MRRSTLKYFFIGGVIFCYCVYYVILSSSTGIGGQNFQSVMVQCVFKSFGHLEAYQKSSRVWQNVTEILRSQSDHERGYFAFEFPTDKDDRHNYTAYYDLLFPLYLSESVNILEIGVKKGGSLKLWRELFSVDSHIYGIDIDPGVNTFVMDSHIKVMVFDSRNKTLMKRAIGSTTFDIVIDDGEHSPDAQFSTFMGLIDHLKPTGLYVIEDVYSFDSSLYIHPSFNMSYSVHADKSQEEDLIFLYPKLSKVPQILSIGLKRSGGPVNPKLLAF